MERGYTSIQQACAQMIRNRDPQGVVETMFEGFRIFDDDLHDICARLSPSAIVAARCAIQSLQWSMHPVSLLRRAQTIFLRLQAVISTLADTSLKNDERGRHRFDSMTTELTDSLKALDNGMQEVFPTNSPYVTALYVQLHSPHRTFQPVLTEQVLLSFPLLLLVKNKIVEGLTSLSVGLYINHRLFLI